MPAPPTAVGRTLLVSRAIGPFIAAIYGGTAGVPRYHAACDTIANVSDTGLDQMSDAIAHSIITFAQNTSLVNGAKGKGNFKRPSTGGDGFGTRRRRRAARPRARRRGGVGLPPLTRSRCGTGG